MLNIGIALFQVVPKDRRGVAQGLFSLTTALGNFGPVLVGRLAGGEVRHCEEVNNSCMKRLLLQLIQFFFHFISDI